MKRQLINFLFAVSLLIPLSLLPGERLHAAGDKAGALVTVEIYLNALIHGDIPGIKRTLSPGFLHNSVSTLDSPSYGATLRSLYANAKFRVLGASSSGSDRIKVDTELSLSGGHLMQASFILVRETNGVYLIDEEVQ